MHNNIIALHVTTLGIAGNNLACRNCYIDLHVLASVYIARCLYNNIVPATEDERL